MQLRYVDRSQIRLIPYSTGFSTGFDPAPDSAPDSALDSAPDSFKSYYAINRLSLKMHSYLTKASCFSLPLMQQLFFYWLSVGQKNGKYSDHLIELPRKNKCSVPPGIFRKLWLEIHSYLTKASCFSLLLMQQLFLYGSPVGQKNGKYNDLLSELHYKKKTKCPLEYLECFG